MALLLANTIGRYEEGLDTLELDYKIKTRMALFHYTLVLETTCVLPNWSEVRSRILI